MTFATIAGAGDNVVSTTYLYGELCLLALGDLELMIWEQVGASTRYLLPRDTRVADANGLESSSRSFSRTLGVSLAGDAVERSN